MEIRVGSLVESIRGKDKGELFFVKELSNSRVYLINGYNRTTKMPKIKNLKHIILKKNYDLDFKFVKNCDIIYKIRCFKSDL